MDEERATQPVKRAHKLWLALGLVIVVGLLGWVLAWRWPKTLVDSDQMTRGSELANVSPAGQPVGQTFVARHAGLAGIEFYLVPPDESPVTLTLHLRTDPDSAKDLRSTTVQLSSDASPGFYGFDFDPVDASHGGYYYAFLDSMAEGVSVSLAGGKAYLDGAAYQAHQPLDAQATFRLVYATGYVVLDLLKAIGGWAGSLLAAGLLFLVPGWALLSWLLPDKRLSWAETMGLTAGIGLALYPLLFLWTDLAGLHLGPLYAWLPPALGLVALGWRYRGWRPRRGWEAAKRWTASEALWPDVALLVVLALVFAVRLLVVRTLAVPMWGDSYQHTMVAQLLVDHGGLFDSWEPYVPLSSFTYHFGFQASVALYHWLTNADIVQSVITTGQLMNGLAVICLYPLAVKVARSRWAGVIAVLVAGLLSPMPMYYVNWGRYVQLAGQVILPVAMWLTWSCLESQHRLIRLEMLAGLTVAGLALTHYRVTIFYLLFLPVVWLAGTFQARRDRSGLRALSLQAVRIHLLSVFLLLPWIWNLFAGLLPKILGQFANSEAGSSAYNQAPVLRDILTYAPLPLVVTGLMGLIFGLVKRNGRVLVLAIWTALLFLAANPNWLGLPGAETIANFDGVLESFAVIIGLYIPVSILCGYLGSVLIEAASRRFVWPSRMAASGLILALCFLGTGDRLTTLNPAYSLVTTPDLRAMHWIEEHTAQTSKFLSNAFFAYEGHVIVGSDAGWWLPVLAHRQNTVPPITYGHEAAFDPDYATKVNEFERSIENQSLDEPATIQLLQDNQVSYVYIGETGGNLSPDVLEASDAYDLIYHEDRVWIFKVR